VCAYFAGARLSTRTQLPRSQQAQRLRLRVRNSRLRYGHWHQPGRTREALSTIHGLHIILKNAPNLIILDLAMPFPDYRPDPVREDGRSRRKILRR
jgi:hypothetical protein